MNSVCSDVILNYIWQLCEEVQFPIRILVRQNSVKIARCIGREVNRIQAVSYTNWRSGGH